MRALDQLGDRPAVARHVLAPQLAPALVERALRLCPELTVVGVAGPGDALATPHALDALDRVRARFPDLQGCLSTNGLRLAESVRRIVDAGVRAVTVTVNALDPAILARLCAGVVLGQRFVRGEPGAALLARAQRAGITEAARAGLTVKINSVLVPGVNEEHVAEVAREAATLGAGWLNVIPLIPQGELADVPAPSCGLLEQVRREAERHLPVLRGCRRCRADACGALGQADLGSQLYGDGPRQTDTFSHG